MPQFVDAAVDSVVRSMSEGVEPDFWDPFEEDDTWLKLWSGDDWWKFPPSGIPGEQEVRETVPGADVTPVQTVKGFDPERWMSKYTNGKIPLAAMVRVGKEGSGATAYLRPDAAAAWNAVVAAAARDGVQLTITDSYRTYAQQVTADQTKPALAAEPGTSNHGWGIAIDLGEGEQRDWLAANGQKYGWVVLPSESWHFDYKGQGAEGFDPKLIDEDVDRTPSGRKGKEMREFTIPDVTLVPASLGFQPDLAAITYGIYQDARREARPKDAPPAFGGKSGSIKEQLYQGFMDAGRPDLAKMVRTKDFDVWIGAESGWKPGIVSKYYSGHGRNAGLFQFALLDRQWVWSDVNQANWTYAATPYEQARMVVRYFDLTPQDIRTYASQIRAGTYHGWG